MIKIEATTLEQAYTDAAKTLKCSVSELSVEIVQVPSKGLFGMFKKSAIIVATSQNSSNKNEGQTPSDKNTDDTVTSQEVTSAEDESFTSEQRIFNDTIMPQSFVSDQDEEDEELKNGLAYTADYDDSYDEDYEEDTQRDMNAIAQEVDLEINKLFETTCFNIDRVSVSVYDEETLLVEFTGEDAALLIGKEGYRYKALSYMIFNWFNAKYDVQLRLEIAEFLKNQEEAVCRYLTSVYENVDRDGRAQTKILDGVLVQIALKELRERYPEKYVVIRSTKDGLKYIIINDYHN